MRNQAATADRHVAGHEDPSRIRWGSAAAAGIIGGLVFMMAEMLMVWIFLGQSPWGPPRMIAAMAMGREVLPPPADFALAPMMVAMIIHFMLSIVYGFIVAMIVRRMGMAGALATGAVFGLVAVYLLNFHVVAPILFPWFTEAQNWVSVTAHVLFGMVVAGAYVALRGSSARS